MGIPQRVNGQRPRSLQRSRYANVIAAIFQPRAKVYSARIECRIVLNEDLPGYCAIDVLVHPPRLERATP